MLLLHALLASYNISKTTDSDFYRCEIHGGKILPQIFHTDKFYQDFIKSFKILKIQKKTVNYKDRVIIFSPL